MTREFKRSVEVPMPNACFLQQPTISTSPPSNLYGESPTLHSSIGLTRSLRVGGGPIICLHFRSFLTESIKSFSTLPIPEESDVGSDCAWPTG
ncbi:hypothetical protein L208DRAFT_1401162, partial [Tricholoma matsutake]